MRSEKFVEFKPVLSTVLSQSKSWQELAVLVAWDSDERATNFEDHLELFKYATVALRDDLTVLLNDLYAYNKKRSTHK